MDQGMVSHELDRGPRISAAESVDGSEPLDCWQTPAETLRLPDTGAVVSQQPITLEIFPSRADYTNVCRRNSDGPARRIQSFDQMYQYNGSVYIPFHSVPVAAGVFLAPSMDWIENHLRLLQQREFGLGIRDQYQKGRRTYRRHLGAARVQGDSMIERGIHDGYVIVFQSSGFDYVEHGRILAIEKVGEEQGWGAWSLKRLIIERPRFSSVDEFQDEIDWEEPDITLRSHNRRIDPWQLDRSGQYRVRAALLRSLHPEDVHLVESESLHLAMADESIPPQ
jgi:hypothetical protein